MGNTSIGEGPGMDMCTLVMGLVGVLLKGDGDPGLGVGAAHLPPRAGVGHGNVGEVEDG
eukprot:CAMPEP_0184667940 /NCGR_PEP_ID=MMETSP0308-20130426/69973_1 /TAXON_ID=38269 /ORGANISM="Gloeochaete witrockiana, Strain SAG 46.84" /LENGTH=58 /DNA_ID=CAMNT_0027113405 /DNA_START=285 /DNA_END=457 /DNA_ORIENTATION=-